MSQEGAQREAQKGHASPPQAAPQLGSGDGTLDTLTGLMLWELRKSNRR